jgi:hypothetical protein
MGQNNLSNRSATTIRLPTICQRYKLSDKINTVVVDRPSPTSKKRPAAAGLFLI